MWPLEKVVLLFDSKFIKSKRKNCNRLGEWFEEIATGICLYMADPETAGFYPWLFILCYMLLLNSNIFLGCCIQVPYRNWHSINKEQNTFQVLVFQQSGLVCSPSFPFWGIPRVEMRGLNSILPVRRCWPLSSSPTSPSGMAFHSCGWLLILLAGSHCSWWGLTKWFLSSSLGPVQGKTLQKKTSLLDLCREEADCCILSRLVLFPYWAGWADPAQLPHPNGSLSIPKCPSVSF